MELCQYVTSVFIICFMISYVVDGDGPIMNKRYIRDKDNFTVTCNASSFKYPPINGWNHVTKYKIFRKVEFSNNVEMLAEIQDISTTSARLNLKTFPGGRFWSFSYELYGHSAYITLHVDDANKADLGHYWCEAELKGVSNVYKSPVFILRSLALDGGTPIMSKKYIRDKDRFTMKCNASSFKAPYIYGWNNITKYKMYRKVESSTRDVHLGEIRDINTPSARLFLKGFPAGRFWKFSHELNGLNAFIALHVDDATKADVGYYWCEAEIKDTGEVYSSSLFNLKSHGDIVIRMDPIKVTPQKSGSLNTSYNFLGDTVIMECTFTGWDPMQTSWSLNTFELEHNRNVTVFDTIGLLGSHGCRVYSHKSTKIVLLDYTYRDSTFFCRALSQGDTVAFASMRFTLSDHDYGHLTSQASAMTFEKKAVLITFWIVLVNY